MAEQQETTRHRRYDQLQTIGQGTYGRVVKVRVKETQKTVAVKYCFLGENGTIPAHVVREISFLKLLQPHQNIVKLLNVFFTRNHVCIELEYIKLNLFHALHPLNLPSVNALRVRTWFRQIVDGVAWMHSRGVMHRDLKPENILIDDETDTVKLADFGISRQLDHPVNGPYTPQVATRAYRAPELFDPTQLIKKYGPAIDIWSLGCLLFEMFSGRMLFPGETDIQVYSNILAVVNSGDISACLVQKCPKLLDHKKAHDLILRLVVLDPLKRPSACALLDDPFFV